MLQLVKLTSRGPGNDRGSALGRPLRRETSNETITQLHWVGRRRSGSSDIGRFRKGKVAVN
jgi:hypothetical protein